MKACEVVVEDIEKGTCVCGREIYGARLHTCNPQPELEEGDIYVLDSGDRRLYYLNDSLPPRSAFIKQVWREADPDFHWRAVDEGNWKAYKLIWERK